MILIRRPDVFIKMARSRSVVWVNRYGKCEEYIYYMYNKKIILLYIY